MVAFRADAIVHVLKADLPLLGFIAWYFEAIGQYIH